MFNRLKNLLLGNLIKQLVVGLTLVIASIMTLFIWEMTSRQQDEWIKSHSQQVTALSESAATSSAVWVASRDYSGLQEIVQGIARYPGLSYIIMLDLKGQVLADNDPGKIGLYLTDLPLQQEGTVLYRTEKLVEAITPILLAGKQVGWVRLGIDRMPFSAELARTRREGIIFTLIGIAFSFLIANLAGRYLTRRFYAIQKVADAVKAGQTAVRVNLSGDDEAAKLARQFNDMLDSLEQREVALKHIHLMMERTESMAHLAGFEWEVDTNIVTWSPEMFRIFGRDPALGVPNLEGQAELYTPQSTQKLFEAVSKAVSDGTPYELELMTVQPDGEQRPCFVKGFPERDSSGRVVRLAGLLQDISERKQIEKEAGEMREQLAQASKMESIGHLTAGIAHDFNNMLGAMLGYTELSQHMLAAGKANAIEPYLAEIYKSGTRAKELIRQMLTFSRLSPGETGGEVPITVLSTIVKEVLSMLRTSTPSTIDLNYSIETEGLRARILPVNLHQIMLNLVVNARDALGEYGRIDITLSQQHYEHKPCSSCKLPISGDYVQIKVQDSGSGIPGHILNKIFDPFFTTKGVGKGTGMGLSVVHGLVHAQKGHILVTSSPENGTAVNILLPMETTDASPQVISNTISSVSMIKGIRVMLVDDEPALANMLNEFLSSQGAHIIAFTDPAKALEGFIQNADNFDIVITDETMPGMSGMLLSEKFLKVKPELPIILCTGYSDRATPEAAAQVGIAAFFYKPLNMNDLLQKIHTLCAAKTKSSS